MERSQFLQNDDKMAKWKYKKYSLSHDRRLINVKAHLIQSLYHQDSGIN